MDITHITSLLGGVALFECLEIPHVEDLASDVEVQSEELDVLHLGS